MIFLRYINHIKSYFLRNFFDGAAGRRERLHHGRREPEQPRAHGQPVAVPRDFTQPIRHIAGEVLLLPE